MLRTLYALVLVVCLCAAAGAQVPSSKHVFIVVEENHSYSSVIGSSSMPYLNSLATKYGLATQYYANTHPSIGNYFELTTGQIITNNDSYTGTVTADNVVRHLITAGKTWKAYAESLPSVGYLGGDTGSYTKHHNPFAYFSDVVNSSSEKLNIVPFTQFPTDLNNNTLPNYSFIIPNRCNDAHDCSLTTADNWLKTNIAPLLASSTFQQDGILIIVFDESTSTDTAHGGGHVAWVVVGPKVKPGYKSTTLYQHQSTLRLMMQALGLTTFPGAASTAPAMGEFFGTSTTTTSSGGTTTTLTPVAVLTVSPTSGKAPLTVTADSSKSYETGGTIASRLIKWGDGTSTTATTATHRYKKAGKYTVTLTVTDASGTKGTATATVTVTRH